MLFIGFLAIFASKAQAQNLQLLADTERHCITGTFEMFRPDAFGSTFCFVDMDYKRSAIGAYTEVAREFCFWQDTDWAWLSIHAEFNGGLEGAYSFPVAWLAGLTYSGHTADYNMIWSLTASYKAIPGLYDNQGNRRMHSMQITGVWGMNFFDGWCSFSGFADVWREASTHIFLSEPQVWVNLNKIPGCSDIPFSIGGELELSYNFGGIPGFKARPAFGGKWTF